MNWSEWSQEVQSDDDKPVESYTMAAELPVKVSAAQASGKQSCDHHGTKFCEMAAKFQKTRKDDGDAPTAAKSYSRTQGLSQANEPSRKKRTWAKAATGWFFDVFSRFRGTQRQQQLSIKFDHVVKLSQDGVVEIAKPDATFGSYGDGKIIQTVRYDVFDPENSYNGPPTKLKVLMQLSPLPVDAKKMPVTGTNQLTVIQSGKPDRKLAVRLTRRSVLTKATSRDKTPFAGDCEDQEIKKSSDLKSTEDAFIQRVLIERL